MIVLFASNHFTLPSLHYLKRSSLSRLRRSSVVSEPFCCSCHVGRISTDASVQHGLPDSNPRPPRHLVQFRRSRFVAHFNELRRRRLLPDDVTPDPPTRLSAALTEAGRIHEDRVVAHLQSLISHSSPLYTVPFAHPQRHDLTKDAISRRVPLIRAAALHDNLLDGYADLLIRADINPFLPPQVRANSHPFTYCVCEIKLASHRTPDHILQAAVYYSLLDRLLFSLGAPSPPHTHLWLGGSASVPVCLPSRPLTFLFQTASHDFAKFLKTFNPRRTPAPDGPLTEMAPWSTHAESLLRNVDSLRLIAGIRRQQADVIARSLEVPTLTYFARMPPSAVSTLARSRIIPPASRRLHRQAVMQFQARQHPRRITFEIDSDAAHSLPAASSFDVFLDIEGFPLAPDGGLEYLFGAHCAKTGKFFSWWAHSGAQEETAFIALMQWLGERIKKSGSSKFRVYHYGHYEIAALRRVALRAVTPNGMRTALSLDALIESNIFFDVYKFVKSALIIGASSYSIKKVERLAGISRESDDLADAESSVAMYYEWRRKYLEGNTSKSESAVLNEGSHPILREIYSYNRRDCDSLEKVVHWLRQRFPEEELVVEPDRNNDVKGTSASDAEADIMPGACGRSNELRLIDSIAITRSAEVSDVLLRAKHPSLIPSGAQALAHILQFYVRESAPDRRLFRERVEMASSTQYEDLYSDEKCIVGVRHIGTLDSPDSRGKSVLAYSFHQDQQVAFNEGERAAFVMPSNGSNHSGGLKNNRGNITGFVTVKSIVDGKKGDGCIYISAGNKAQFNPPSFGVLVSSDNLTICDAPLRQSILRKAEELLMSNFQKKSTLGTAFLNRDVVVENHTNISNWMHSFEANDCNVENLSKFMASRKDPRVFVIQGPPGTGKTFLSGKLINDLIRKHNKTIAVTSNSHAAIDNLLNSAIRAGLDSNIVWKVGTRTSDENNIGFKANVRELDVKPLNDNNEEHNSVDNKEGNKGLRSSSKRKRNYHATLVGATCYQLCREESDGKFDILFIDEASQVPMAHLLAISSSAKYAVLVGDQQQLEMPIKGSHFGSVGQSCLSYMVGEGVTTVEPSRGIFLRTSFRMNAALCEFVSNSFYGGALLAAPSCEGNDVITVTNILGKQAGNQSGIWFIPCHGKDDSNTDEKPQFGKWHRPEEVDIIHQAVTGLLGAKCTVGNEVRHLRESDILVVAPYNAQVRALRASLPSGVRVGTVDKFQGQEAPIALISTCTSGSEKLDDEEFLSGEQDFSEEKWSPENMISWDSSQRDQRGVRFCLRKNRLNVAISRAQCLAIVTGDKDACSKLPLNKLDDLETAALYDDLVSIGNQLNNPK